MILDLPLALLALSTPARAHGIWAHIHVTGWAVENMPDDELRAFLLEPEVFNALLFGAVFTDTGYSLSDSSARTYSEHAHWEPFVEEFIEWELANDPPPWTTLESRKRAAFLMGVASHGFQDEIFDSLFLIQVGEHDGAGQDEADPGTDGFLVMDEHVRFVPERDLPMDALLELYADVDEGIDEELITRAVDLVTAVYINDTGGQNVAVVNGELYADELAWTRTHYMDPEVPGSIRSEVFPTRGYQQALWDRLHGELYADDTTIYGFPEPPRRLRSWASGTVDGWTTLMFGVGVLYQDDMVELLDADGANVPFTQGNSRWGPDWTRLVDLRPDEDLEPGGWYKARLLAGAETIDGQMTTSPWELSFQVECDGEDLDLCPALGDVAVASIDGLVDDEGEDTGESPGEEGCGCAGASGGGGGWFAGLSAVLGVLRRRPGGPSVT